MDPYTVLFCLNEEEQVCRIDGSIDDRRSRASERAPKLYRRLCRRNSIRLTPVQPAQFQRSRQQHCRQQGSFGKIGGSSFFPRGLPRRRATSAMASVSEPLTPPTYHQTHWAESRSASCPVATADGSGKNIDTAARAAQNVDRGTARPAGVECILPYASAEANVVTPPKAPSPVGVRTIDSLTSIVDSQHR